MGENPSLPRPIDELGTIVLTDTSINVRRTIFAPFPCQESVSLPICGLSLLRSSSLLRRDLTEQEQSRSQNFTNQGDYD